MGDQFLAIALLWLTLGLTRKPSTAGMVLMAYTAGAVVSGLFAGSVLDRYPRKAVMLIDNALRALFIGGLALAGWLHVANVPIIVTLAVAAAIVSAWTIVGGRAYLPALVPESVLTTAFAVDNAQVQTAGILGPALAGLVTARFSPEASLACAAALYLCFIVFAGFIPRHALDAGAPPGSKPLSIEEEFKGARYVIGHPVLRPMTALIFVSSIFIGASIIGIAFLSNDAFGLGARGQGILLATEAIGSIAASFLLGAIRWPFGRGKSVIAANIVFGILLIAIGFAPTFLVACALALVAGFADAAFFVFMSEIRQRTPPPELQARVVGASMILNFAGWPLGEGAAGFAASAIGARRLLNVAGGLLALYSALYLLGGKLRTAE